MFCLHSNVVIRQVFASRRSQRLFLWHQELLTRACTLRIFATVLSYCIFKCHWLNTKNWCWEVAQWIRTFAVKERKFQFNSLLPTKTRHRIVCPHPDHWGKETCWSRNFLAIYTRWNSKLQSQYTTLPQSGEW